MAHLIDTSNGRASCMVAGAAAWHKLGVVVAEAQTSEEAIRLANLDWLVNKVALRVFNPTAECWLDVPDHFAMQRSDTDAVLGVVGAQYEPMQNGEAFDFMDGLLGKDVARFETAGAIKDGRVVWMLARLPGEIVADRDGRDVVEPYILLTNSHDGSRAVQILPTTVRVLCNNTLSMALAGKHRLSFTMKHTRNLAKRIEEARKALGLVRQRAEGFAEGIRQLGQIQVSDAKAADYFKKVFEMKTLDSKANGAVDGAAVLGSILEGQAARREIVADLLKADSEFTERQRRNERELLDQLVANFQSDLAAGTAWGAVNAVTEYVDHQQRRRNEESRFSAALLGEGARVKDAAFQAAFQLAG
jgi:phage/plasmid-like protein (TIGR03299 family)